MWAVFFLVCVCVVTWEGAGEFWCQALHDRAVAVEECVRYILILEKLTFE